jgi:hypothetical protein
MKIDKNIPPMAGRASSRDPIWPLLQMDVGDSILIPIKDYSPSRVHTILTTIRSVNTGWVWSARMVKADGGTRIWCLHKPDTARKASQ